MTAVRCFFHCKIVLFVVYSLIPFHFCLTAFSRIQVWWMSSYKNSTPSHHAKATQGCLQNVVYDFVSAEEWAPHSPTLNPLDYRVQDILRETCLHLPLLEQKLTRVYGKFTPVNHDGSWLHVTKVRIIRYALRNCMYNVITMTHRQWFTALRMSASRLELNTDKMKLLWVGSHITAQLCWEALDCHYV